VDASMLAAKGCLGLNSPRIFCGVACVFDLPTPFLAIPDSWFSW